MTSPAVYFNLDGWEHAELFVGLLHVWEALERLPAYLQTHLEPGCYGHVEPGAFLSEQVYLGPGAYVESGAYIKGPAIVGSGTVVRHGAYVRENCLIGSDCVVGHATELKSVIMLDQSQAPHFNYVGDSILGRRVNLGAGTRLANLKADHGNIVIRCRGQSIDTGLNKLGAILGDDVQTGCNVVTSPGTLLGPGSRVYATALLRGVYPPNTLIKVRQTQVTEAITFD